MGIGPTQPAWKAGILPLNYTRTRNAVNNAYELYQNVILMSTVYKLFFKKINEKKLLLKKSAFVYIKKENSLT